jgi:hypothetical protein
MVIRRWATPFVWLAFTALATTVGLASVSVVRHAVIATSLQATSAKDITRVLDVPNASPTGEPTQTATNPILGPTSDSAHPVQTPLNTFTPTWSPTPTAAATPTRPVVPTYSHTSTARPTEPGDGGGTVGPTPTSSSGGLVVQQPYEFGSVSARCSAGRAQLVSDYAAPGYRVAEIQAASGTDPLTINFQATDGSTGPDASVTVSCNAGGAPVFGVVRG